MTTVRVTTAAQAASRDEAAIGAGTDSFALMLQAGTVAAAEIVRQYASRLARGAVVLVGAGNNGGDGYVVAAQLGRLGVAVRVFMAAPPRSPDGRRAHALAKTVLPADAFEALADDVPSGAKTRGVVVDALLGTGATGALRGAVAVGAAYCRAASAAGVPVIALDVPTGVDATSGTVQAEHVQARLTITFGTCKIGLLAARDVCGRIVVADIGLGAHAALDDEAAVLADAGVLRTIVPPIAWDAHKGTRGRVLVVGGGAGMAGAVQFVAHGALASGAGLVRALAHPDSARALQIAVPAVVCVSPDALHELVATWAHAVVLGPGLGRDQEARAMVQRVMAAILTAHQPPALVLDADALMLLATPDGVTALREIGGRATVVLTPHAGECAALADACEVHFSPQQHDPVARAHAARSLAKATACVVLLKGTPTVCAAPSGTVWCVPRGSAALATGGTGDVLAGVLAAVLASVTRAETLASPPVAHVALAAWVHGVAGERAGHSATVRGTTVQHVMHALGDAWAQLLTVSPLVPGVLAELPAAHA